MKRLRRSVLVIALASVSALAATTWLSAQNPSPDAPVPVDTIPAGQRLQRLAPDDRGATYYFLESQARRTTTTFADAAVISERSPDGDYSTRLRDLQGNELARLKVDRLDAADSLLVYQPTQGSILRANARAGLRTTLDWGNEQAYSLWKDGGGPAAGAAQLEWQGDVIRPAGKIKRDLKRQITELRTEWNGGLAAKTARKRASRQNPATGAVVGGNVDGDVVVTTFTKDDVVVGTTVWDAERQLFAWRFPGLSEGDVDAARLEEIGGWQFIPDMAWTNVQAYAFYELHTQLAEQSQAARLAPGWLDKLVGLVEPTVSANEPGCDHLHWLDGSMFRPCCDSHDRCYSKAGCSQRTWWSWFSSWQCDVCNLAVVGCFSTGSRGPFYQYPWLYWY